MLLGLTYSLSWEKIRNDVKEKGEGIWRNPFIYTHMVS